MEQDSFDNIVAESRKNIDSSLMGERILSKEDIEPIDENNNSEIRPRNSQNSSGKNDPLKGIKVSDEQQNNVKEPKSFNDSQNKSNISDAVEEPDESESFNTVKQELKDLQDRYNGMRHWSDGANRKIQLMPQLIGKLVDDGILSEEDATQALQTMEHDDINSIAGEAEEQNIYTHLDNSWKDEIANIKRYSGDEKIDQYVEAFNHYVNNNPTSEVESVIQKLASIKDPLLSTKKMIEKGKSYYNESYKELSEAGGFASLLKQNREALLQKQTQIDKLEHKLLQYKEDKGYIKSSTYGIGSKRTTGSSNLETGSSFDQVKNAIMQERFR